MKSTAQSKIENNTDVIRCQSLKDVGIKGLKFKISEPLLLYENTELF